MAGFLPIMALLLPVLAFVLPIGASRAAALPLDLQGRLQAQIFPCWQLPPGAGGKVTLRFDLDSRGRLLAPPRVDGFASPGLGAAASRAVSRCAPYALPPGRYAEWQHVQITFETLGH